MRKYINSGIACTIYKQMIVPLSDHADFMIKSSPMNKISRLGKLHKRAVRTINNKLHPGLAVDTKNRYLWN